MMPERIGTYSIESEVGRGGMGVVYRGEDPRLRRPVAIKVLPEAFAADPERLLTSILLWNLVINIAYFAVASVLALRLERAGETVRAVLSGSGGTLSHAWT